MYYAVQKNRSVPLYIICCVSVLNLIFLKEKLSYQCFALRTLVLLVKITAFLDRFLQRQLTHSLYNKSLLCNSAGSSDQKS